MASTNTKLLFLHLEAAEPSLIEQWCEEGKLPNIARIKKDGVYGRLDPPGYIDSGCVWPTFSTATNPGKHGIGFFPRQLQNGTYNIIKKYASDLKEKHFWDILSENGIEMLVMDMPLSVPSLDFKGTLICNWGDEHVSNPPSSIPENLINSILEKYGKNVLTEWYQHKLESKEEWKELKDTIIDAINLRTDIYLDLLQNRSWQAAVLNFGEIHWAGHMAWHLNDSDHPEFDQEVYNVTGNIILDSYVTLDQSLGKILEIIPRDTNIIITSPLGMGAQVGGEMMLNEILQKLELTPPKRNKKTVLSKIKSTVLPGRKGSTEAVMDMEKLISPKLMMSAKRFVPTKVWDKWTRRFLDLGNTRAESKAFQVPGDHSGLIRVNLVGREPQGRVNPGKEYDELFDFIDREFRLLKDPDDGTSIVKDVIKLRDRLSGNLVDEMPDIAIVWRENKVIEKVESPTFGSIHHKEYHKRSGGHINTGFWIASGPDLASNRRIPMADVMDVVPTILSIFNLEKPPYMDGKVRKEALVSS